jgi:hypothetical protein
MSSLSLDVDRILATVESIKPLLAGLHPGVQGAALAELLAIWLAGHRTSDPDATKALQHRLLRMHMDKVRALTRINNKNTAAPL